MTPEEMNHTIESLLQHAATFSTQMDELKLRQEEFARRQERDHEVLVQSMKSTDKFAAWATEVMAVQSRRLDEHDHRLPPGEH